MRPRIGPLPAERDAEKAMHPANYARHLRAIGQDIENLGLKTFNLECTADSYLVWVRTEATDVEPGPLSRLTRIRLPKLRKNQPEVQTPAQTGYLSLRRSAPIKRFRYSVREIDRIEQEGRSRRCENGGIMDGHKLSQLLRTVGEWMEQRRDRLLGISWQELSVSIVFQTAQGRREIEVFRPDNLYDLGIKMYLRRNDRAISDTPR
jgi:hypothetical protein